MKIAFDNIIYNLQSVGGISHYWYFLTDTLLKHNTDLQFVEHSGDNNFFKKKSGYFKTQLLLQFTRRYSCLYVV